MPPVAIIVLTLFRNLLLKYCCGSVHSRYQLSSCEVELFAYADDSAVFCMDKTSVSEATFVTQLEPPLTSRTVAEFGPETTKPEVYEGMRWGTMSH